MKLQLDISELSHCLEGSALQSLARADVEVSWWYLPVILIPADCIDHGVRIPEELKFRDEKEAIQE